MRRLVALLVLFFACHAEAAGPILWYGANSKDLTTNGLITTGVTVNHSIPDGPTDYVAIDVQPTESAGVTNYSGFYEHSNLDPLYGNYYGAHVVPTIVGAGGSEVAYGVVIDMSNITNVATKTGLYVVGNSIFSGSIASNTLTTQTDAGSVTSNLEGDFSIADGLTPTDMFGYNLVPNTSVYIGDGTTITSYASHVGYSPLLSSLTVNVGAGSTLDYATGVASTVNMAGTGAVTNLTMFKAVADDAGGLATNLRGFEYTDPFSVNSSNVWAFYSGVASADVYFAGATKVGPGSASPSISAGLEVERTILLKSPASASLPQPTLLWSEDPDSGTDTVTVQAPASLAASYTLTWPPDDGSSTQVLTTNGSGVLSWASDVGFANPMDGAGQMIYGGTAGAPTKLAAGSSTQVLHGSATVPSWGAVSLTADVTGVLPLANGGTNKNMTAVNGGVVWTDADSQEVSAAGTSGQYLKSNGTSAPSFGAIDLSTASVTGILPLANGGTNKNATAVNGGLVWSDADSMEITAAGTASQWVLSGGAATPTMSNTTTTAKTIDGSADAIQLLVEGNATQTSDILDVRKSDGSTYLLQVTNVNGTAIRGTTTNDAAGTGFVGQYVSDSSSSRTSLPTTAQYGDMGSISLTAGDWDISLIASLTANGATIPTALVGIGTASGNSGTGLVEGDNTAEGIGPTAASLITMSVPTYRVSLSGTTIYYAKIRATYTVATPQRTFRISARRIR